MERIVSYTRTIGINTIQGKRPGVLMVPYKLGDANAMMGTKHIDPALCIYLGAYLMCIDNKHLTDQVPRGNGTLC